MDVETSRDAVEEIATAHDAAAAMMRQAATTLGEDANGVALAAGARQSAEDTAAMLRALLAERDTARAEVERLRGEVEELRARISRIGGPRR